MPGVTTALRASGAFEKAIALEELDMADAIATVQKISAVYNLWAATAAQLVVSHGIW